MNEARHSVPVRCPVCSTGMYVERVRCEQCGSSVEGKFSLDWPAQLTREQLAFVKVFVSCRGKIKDVEQALGVSYPTVVSRLDEVVDAVTGPQTSPQPVGQKESARRLTVLERLAGGELNLDEAERLLREEKEHD